MDAPHCSGAHREGRHRSHPLDPRRRRRFLTEHFLADPNRYGFLIARHGGRAVGMLTCHAQHLYYADATVVSCLSLYVPRPVRRTLLGGRVTLRLLDAGLAALDAEAQRLRAARAGEAAQIETLAPLIELAGEHEDGLRRLFEKGLTGRGQWFDARRELPQRERERVRHRHRVRQLDAEFASVARRREETVAEFRHRSAASRVEALGRMEQARLELRSASLRAERNRLRAPVDGTVQQLSVHTVGGVVRSAEPLMVVVPHGVTLEVEANVLNRDIGFVEIAQTVEVKVEAFPFTRYGLIDGEVVQLSADAVLDETLGPVYPMKVKLAAERIRVNDRWVDLAPGMSVAAEVKTGKRRAIEFFLAPLLRYRSEALRER